MRRLEFIAGTLIWVAAAALMPMAALAPVPTAPASASAG
jgi:hypothetical protein